MKRVVWLFLVFMAVFVPDYSFAIAAGPARVMFQDGDILFRAEDDEEWLLASVNTPLYEGDAVWCPDGSKVEIQLPEGSIVRLDGGSQLHLLENKEDFIHLYLASGRLYLRTAKTLPANYLQIDADDTTVLPASRTRLRLDMLSNSQEDVSILKGSAYVEGNGNRTRVHAGDHIVLEDERSELLPLNPPDRWESWNIRRDRAQARSVNADAYLPEELQSYAAELNANGTWVSVPEYGMVWRPAVVVSANWSPYTNGRWVWRGNDYVWISFDLWGWAPFHYGRWSAVTGFGWCWVPPMRGDVYWGPGYVGWYRNGSYIGWTPLAPRETYYGHGHYGQNSVNITNTTINITKIEYKNRHARGGMTVVQHDDFLKGRVLRSSAVKTSVPLKVSTGRPGIKPLRETRMPLVKPIPPRKLPIRSDTQATRDLRQRFPKVKDDSAHDQRQQNRPAAAPAATPSVQATPQKVKAERGRGQQQEDRSISVTPAKPSVQASSPRVTRPPEKPVTAAPQAASQPAAALPANRIPSRRTEVPAGAEQRSDAQQVEKPQRQSRQSAGQQRKIWRVTTPEPGKAGAASPKDSKVKVNKTGPLKDKEVKEREQKGK